MAGEWTSRNRHVVIGVPAVAAALLAFGEAFAAVNQIPQQPVNIQTPHGPVLAYSLINSIMILVVVGLLIREAIRTRSLFPIAFLVAGVLAGFVEPVFDGNIHVWFAHPPGDTPTYYFYNVPYPWYVVPANCILGGPVYWMYHKFQRGISNGGLWIFFLFWWAFDSLWELPGTTMGAYGYFGPQPFVFSGFPLWVGMMAGFGLPVAGYVAYGLSKACTGARLWWLTVICVPVAIYGSEVIAWPMWDALNGAVSPAAASAAAVLSLVFTAGAYYGLTVVYAKERDARGTAAEVTATRIEIVGARV